MTSSLNSGSRLADAVECLVSTRDMCGDEKLALRDWEFENGQLEEHEKRAVLEQVETEWRESQTAAGARILSAEQRIDAYRALA